MRINLYKMAFNSLLPSDYCSQFSVFPSLSLFFIIFILGFDLNVMFVRMLRIKPPSVRLYNKIK